MSGWLTLRVVRDDYDSPDGIEPGAVSWIVQMGMQPGIEQGLGLVVGRASTKDEARRVAVNKLREMADLIERGAV